MKPTIAKRRTNWAEEFAEHFTSRPLVHECVFRSAKYLDRTEKEVCDLLLVLRNRSVILQMKCQEDPQSRSGEKLDRWVVKHAAEALAQVRGAAKTMSEREIWCEHPRRGRVDFQRGQLTLLHGIVLVEHFSQRIALPGTFALDEGLLPISYFTTNDFLNIIEQLRAFPEIVRYLDKRHQLPGESLRGVGGEKVFFQQYILGNASFEAWTNYSEAEQDRKNTGARFKPLLKPKLQLTGMQALLNMFPTNFHNGGQTPDRISLLRLRSTLNRRKGAGVI